MAERLKAHARRACGQRILSRGFESHPVRSLGASDGAVFLFGAWLSPVERCVRDAEVPGSNPGAPIGCLHSTTIAPAHGSRRCRSAAVLERWQNGNALASKASARKGLGVRVPRAPYLKT